MKRCKECERNTLWAFNTCKKSSSLPLKEGGKNAKKNF